jgi:GNAT superfamily N-acetyltransferase
MLPDSADAEPLLRPVRPEDIPSVIELIDRCYAEYGDRVCLTGSEQDLLELPHAYHRLGGAFVVLWQSGQVVGSHACHPLGYSPSPSFSPPPSFHEWTFRRLYLDANLRGGESAARLMQWAIDYVIARGGQQVRFWSDSRFHRAHRFFQRFGFEATGRKRSMDDGWTPYSEYEFLLRLSD